MGKVVNKFWSRFLLWAFRLLYHQLAFAYDLVAFLVSGGKWRRWVIKSSRFLIGQPILELGFGTGHLQVELIRRGIKIFGLDESAQMCRVASRRLSKIYQKEGLPFGLTRGKAQTLPFANGIFMSIVATFPSPYILEASTIEECWRVLSPQGRLIILMGVRQEGRSLYARFIRWLFGVTHQSVNREGVKPQWLDKFTQRGFRVEQYWYRSDEDGLWFIIAEKSSMPFAND